MISKAIIAVFLILASSGIVFPIDLQQNLAQKIVIWVHDSSTGLPKTGVTAASCTCEIVKSDMSASSFTPTASGGSNDWVAKANGAYELEITAAQLDIRGPWNIGCSTSGGVIRPSIYDVVALAGLDCNRNGNCADGAAIQTAVNGVPQAVFDVSTSAAQNANSMGLLLNTNLDANTASRLAPTVAGRTLSVSATGGAGLDWIPTGTAQGGGSNTITLAAADTGTAKSYQNGIVVLTGGTGVGQSAIISSYDSTTKIATILFQPNNGNWQTNPTSSTTYAIIPGRR